eukprot:8611550-Karenia_brevis.AAC.1
MALMSNAEPTKRQGSVYHTTYEYPAPLSSDQGVRSTLHRIIGSITCDHKAPTYNRRWKLGNEYLTVEHASRLFEIDRWVFGAQHVGGLRADWNNSIQKDVPNCI